ncbi:MAG: hypothetical protein IJ003_06715 [Candidatus Gastranaerophilales bacterium]|nr:hypothetical protein [Candidatus Gastranaerophilales bacterium]
MKLNFSSYNAINSYSNSQKLQQINEQTSFGSSKARKLAQIIKDAKNFKHINATFDDAVAIYRELGYDVLMKRGSHAVVPLTEKVNLPLVIPHGSSKFVHPFDLKRLQFVINGEIEKALNVH